MARYIDSDKLSEQITTEYCGKCGVYNGELCCSCPMDKALNYIEDAPTADVAPRAELAREIFEEIAQIKKEYASGDIDGDTLYVRLYLLEKKYTEADHETRN